MSTGGQAHVNGRQQRGCGVGCGGGEGDGGHKCEGDGDGAALMAPAPAMEAMVVRREDAKRQGPQGR